MDNIGVIGAGAWGTALACVAARGGSKDRKVTLWAREQEVVSTINHKHVNDLYLPAIPLETKIFATGNFADFETCDMILLVPPAQHLRTIAGQLVPNLSKGTPLIICSKGIERGSQELMTDVLAEVAPGHPIAVLSGPSFAADVAKGLPTAVTLACEDQALGKDLVQAIGLPTFRPYLSDDIIGAEVGGAIKNVMAIACGIVEGSNLGESARAALTARGFAEIVRLGTAMGAKPETMSGLSGLGDLILTCSSRQSRNMSLGVALGEGQTLDEIMSHRNSVAEGVHTAGALVALARAKEVEMPIAEAVEAIVTGVKTVKEAIADLQNRPFTTEN
ncbi:MAG: NAD(P)-dependent glycerol-3-phosphate dehydrogenase [Alphaproteobacteria bacterium]|nr:MAG: NAD(P)-dependent glycerol-3-phosphate dehydrogenase [Alphaproteobacteria bacterium]